jgi:hypothetical protein
MSGRGKQLPAQLHREFDRKRIYYGIRPHSRIMKAFLFALRNPGSLLSALPLFDSEYSEQATEQRR